MRLVIILALLLLSLPSLADVESLWVKPIIEFATPHSSAAPEDLWLKSTSAEAQKISRVDTPTHTRLLPKFTDQGLTFVIQYDGEALKNPRLLLPDLAALTAIHTLTHFYPPELPLQGGIGNDVMTWTRDSNILAELLINAQAGSLSAQAKWAEFKSLALANVLLHEDVAKALNLPPTITDEIYNQSLKKQVRLAKEARKFQREQNKKYAVWKKTGVLEKWEGQEKKLNDLVLANDRQGVRQLLQAYLPWPLMEPVEVRMWQTWLEAIEHPDRNNVTVGFRGLDYETDKLQRLKTSQGERVGLFSTLLTRNQGSYTRRLRSLVTKRVQNGDATFHHQNSDILHVRMTEQMRAHAHDPQGSKFLSFTADPIETLPYIKKDGGIVAVRIDSRRLFANNSSVFPKERELLVPLIVFPDEVIAFRENFDGRNIQSFIEEVKNKTGYLYRGEGPADPTLKKAGESFLSQIFEEAAQIRSCSTVFN